MTETATAATAEIKPASVDANTTAILAMLGKLSAEIEALKRPTASEVVAKKPTIQRRKSRESMSDSERAADTEARLQRAEYTLRELANRMPPAHAGADAFDYSDDDTGYVCPELVGRID